jgi:transcription antitermination factor NusG
MKNWYVINTKPKKEFQVEKLFTEGGIEIYNPKYMHENKIKAFFAGYGFVYFDFPAQYQLVKYTRGVKRVVGSREAPTTIPEEVGLRGMFKKELTAKERVIILLNYVTYQGQLIIEKEKLKKVLK